MLRRRIFFCVSVAFECGGQFRAGSVECICALSSNEGMESITLCSKPFRKTTQLIDPAKSSSEFSELLFEELKIVLKSFMPTSFENRSTSTSVRCQTSRFFLNCSANEIHSFYLFKSRMLDLGIIFLTYVCLRIYRTEIPYRTP